MEEKKFDFFDEKGELKTKEEVVREIEKLYDEEKKQIPQSVFEDLINNENHINVQNTMETFLFCNRNIYITTVIDQELAGNIVDAIVFFNQIDKIDGVPKEQRQPINIYIDTPGGSLTATFSIIDIINLSQTPIHTVVTGMAYSGGFLIAINGHKRFGYKHSSYLYHEGSNDSGRLDAHKTIQSTEFYKKQLKDMKKIVIEKTNFGEDFYDRHAKDDLWLNADEAIKYSIIDEIVTEI